MNQTALCPSCKQDVVFDTADGASVCPACGARFELSTVTKTIRRAKPRDGLIFVAWIFAPAIVGMLFIASGIGPSGRSDKFFSENPVSLWISVILLGLSAISCYAACSWLISRFTDKLWPRVIVGIVLGLCILVCNVIVAVFGACVLVSGV